MGKLDGVTIDKLKEIAETKRTVVDIASVLCVSRQRLNQWMTKNGIAFEFGIVNVALTKKREEEMKHNMTIDEVIRSTIADEKKEEAVDLF